MSFLVKVVVDRSVELALRIIEQDRPQPVPPAPHGLVGDIQTALVQQVFDIAQRERIANGEYRREAEISQGSS